MAKVIVEMKNITKYFYGVPALQGVSFELLEGEIHALMGENGAGDNAIMMTVQ